MMRVVGERVGPVAFRPLWRLRHGRASALVSAASSVGYLLLSLHFLLVPHGWAPGGRTLTHTSCSHKTSAAGKDVRDDVVTGDSGASLERCNLLLRREDEATTGAVERSYLLLRELMRRASYASPGLVRSRLLLRLAPKTSPPPLA